MAAEALGWVAAGWALLANGVHLTSVLLARGAGARGGVAVPLARHSIVAPLAGLADAEPAYLDALLALQRAGAQVLICVADESDAAAAAVRLHWRDAGAGDAPVLVGRRNTFNPKMDNAAKGFDAARGDIVVLCDAGIRLEATGMAATSGAVDSDTGLVLALKHVTGADGIAARLEAAWINGHQARFLLAADRIGMPVASGGATFLSRVALDRVDGWRGFFGYIADDYAIARAVRRAGLRSRLAAFAPEVRLGRRAWSDVWARQVRWARTRLRLPVWPLVVWEPALGLLAALAAGGAALCIVLPHLDLGIVVAYVLAQIALWLGLEVYFLRDRDPTAGPAAAAAALAREALAPVLLIAALAGRAVRWRGTDMGAGWRERRARDGGDR